MGGQLVPFSGVVIGEFGYPLNTFHQPDGSGQPAFRSALTDGRDTRRRRRRWSGRRRLRRHLRFSRRCRDVGRRRRRRPSGERRRLPVIHCPIFINQI